MLCNTRIAEEEYAQVNLDEDETTTHVVVLIAQANEPTMVVCQKCQRVARWATIGAAADYVQEHVSRGCVKV